MTAIGRSNGKHGLCAHLDDRIIGPLTLEYRTSRERIVRIDWLTVCEICRHRQTISSSPSLPAQVNIIV